MTERMGYGIFARLGRSIVDALPVVGGVDVLELIGIAFYQRGGVVIPEGAMGVVLRVGYHAVTELVVLKFLAALVQAVPVLVDAAVMDVFAFVC